MHYTCSRNTYFSTTYYMPVYYVIYKTLSHKHPGIYTSAEIIDQIPPNKWMELERDLSLTLSGIKMERSLETHKIFHPENSL